ncbi:hypothetical protein ACTXK7_15195 [Vreelandella alkaliphila]|uniref:hypothetical protein n=1 Tax=Halomonadaceae TaxID=28256 RepID=UPI001865FD09|nr:hypothetical protein [Halomonas sp. FME65]
MEALTPLSHRATSGLLVDSARPCRAGMADRFRGRGGTAGIRPRQLNDRTTFSSNSGKRRGLQLYRSE